MTWFFHCNLYSKMQKQLQVVVWSCPWSHTLTLCKKHLCSKELKYGINYSWTYVFYYINMFCETLESSQNFLRTGSDHHLFFFAFLKKNYNDRFKHKLFKSWTKWTGLLCSDIIWPDLSQMARKKKETLVTKTKVR